MKTTAALAIAFSLASTLVAQEATVRSLMSKEVAGIPGKELSRIIVEHQPGGSDQVHKHDAQVLVYVLEGSIVMQVKGEAPVTLVPGQAFYEGPDDVHLVSRNASRTAPAKFLVFFVKDKGAPIRVSSFVEDRYPTAWFSQPVECWIFGTPSTKISQVAPS